MAPTGKTFTSELLTASDVNAFLDSARWAPQTTRTTSTPATAIPKTDTWTSAGSAFSVTLPTGWTSMTLQVVARIKYTLGATLGAYSFATRVQADGATATESEAYTVLDNQLGAHFHSSMVVVDLVTVFTAAASVQVQALCSSASAAAITASGVRYDVIRFRES